MPFNIPNAADAFDPNQAEPDSGDIAILVAALAGQGVLSGCEVSALSDQSVRVAAGSVVIGGDEIQIDGGDLAISAGETNPRFDLVVAIDDTGTGVQVIEGTSDAEPVFPAIPADAVVLAAVFVPVDAVEVLDDHIVDKRCLLRDLVAGPGINITNSVGSITIGAIGELVEIVAPTSFPSANSLDIQDIPQTYSALLLVISGLSFDTATRALRMRISSDNGATVNTGGMHGTYVNNAVNSAAGGGSSPIAPGTQTAAQVTTTLVVITGYQAGSFTKFVCAGLDANSVSHSSVVTYLGDTNAINCLRLIMNSTGLIDGGTYALLGRI